MACDDWVSDDTAWWEFWGVTEEQVKAVVERMKERLGEMFDRAIYGQDGRR